MKNAVGIQAAGSTGTADFVSNTLYRFMPYNRHGVEVYVIQGLTETWYEIPRFVTTLHTDKKYGIAAEMRRFLLLDAYQCKIPSVSVKYFPLEFH